MNIMTMHKTGQEAYCIAICGFMFDLCLDRADSRGRDACTCCSGMSIRKDVRAGWGKRTMGYRIPA